MLTEGPLYTKISDTFGFYLSYNNHDCRCRNWSDHASLKKDLAFGYGHLDYFDHICSAFIDIELEMKITQY